MKFAPSFRAVRAVWLVLIALSSAAIIAFAIAVRRYFDRPSDLLVLVLIPAACFICAATALLANRLFTSIMLKSVAIELLWSGCAFSLAFIMCLYTYTILPAADHPDVLWPIYTARALAWELAIATYALVVVGLAGITSSLVDKEVWRRPIASSSSPFPLALMWHVLRQRPSPTGDEKSASESHNCPPGCTCTRKLATDEGWAHISRVDEARPGETERVPGIRVPSAMERYSFIVVELGGVETDFGARESVVV